jgi:SH3-like domain-containing protein
VEILLELGDWRKIRDQDNIVGWVRAPSLWKRRSVIIHGSDRTIRAQADDNAAPIALLKPGVVAHLRSCASGTPWCEVEVMAYRGWLKRDAVYGIYPDEKLDTP